MLASIGAFFSAVWPFLLGVICLTAIFGTLVFLLWLLLGRKKKGEEKAVGIMRQLSVFKGGPINGPGAGGRR